MQRNICVIGAGKWGKNHIKTLNSLNSLGGIVEPDEYRRQELEKEYQVKAFKNLEDAVSIGFDAYIVATPAGLHFEIAKYLLEQKCHVLVEKPMTLSVKEAEELVKIAEKNKVKLMVGHVLLFHPAIIKIKEMITAGKIGELYYLYSTRLNLGTVRTEENVFWSFAPHDISVLNYIVGATPEIIEAKGSKFLQQEVYDYTMTQLSYPNNIHAHIFVSWLHPFKEQRLVVVGSKGMIAFDDSTIKKEILYYDKRIDFVKGKPVKVEEPTEIVCYEKKMPLTEELKYFIENLDKEITIANGVSGLEVVRVLEKAEKLISE